MILPQLRVSEKARKFAREVGSVVLGVVIALGLGEVVESANWASRRSEAQAALQAELSAAVSDALQRQRISGCLQRRLAEVEQVIDGGVREGRIRSIMKLPQPPMRQWRSTAWETVVASQTASRFPVATLNELATAYQTIQQIREWNVQEKAAWTSLSILEGSTKPLTPQLEIHLREAHAKAKYYARIIPLSAGQLRRDIAQAGVAVRVRPGVARVTPDVCEPLMIKAA